MDGALPAIDGDGGRPRGAADGVRRRRVSAWCCSAPTRCGPPKRVNPGDRYRAMEQFFAASQTGAAGAAMMTSTASVQVNLDAGPRRRLGATGCGWRTRSARR